MTRTGGLRVPVGSIRRLKGGAYRSWLIVAALAVLAGLAEPGAAEEPSCPTSGESDSHQPVSDGRQLSEIIGVHSCWAADTGNGKHQYLGDLYGRWIVEQVPLETRQNLVRDYRLEKRSPLARFFVGKSNGAVISVKLKMRDPDVEFTVPLVALNYNGRSGEGQAFVTAITTSEMGLPDFRISPNSSVAVEASARLADEVDVQSTGIVLAAVRDSLSIAAPAGSLLTSVNRDQVQRVAAAYDSALSKLLSTTISESMSAGRLLSEWYPGAFFLVVAEVPESIRTQTVGDTKSSRSKILKHRQMMFRVSMSCPRLSVFDTVSVCERNLRRLINSPYREPGRNDRQIVGAPGFGGETYKKVAADLAGRVNPNQVLAFRLGVGKSLRQFLTEQEWFLSLSKKMVDIPTEEKVIADAAVTNEQGKRAPPASKTLKASLLAADEFCEAVVDKLYSTGLSRLDSKIGLWALATGVSDFAASRSVFQGASRCADHLPGEGWTFMPSA